jgi:putative transposase
MPNYIRFYAGTTWFFTVVTHRRIPCLITDAARSCLREAIIHCRELYPFTIEAWVLLPDHIHCIWDLAESDLNSSRRWSIIKRKFTQGLTGINYQRPPYWQNRFWAHLITDEKDYENHVNYIHYNAVKHGLVEKASEWPWTSLHRMVKAGTFPPDWGEQIDIPQGIGRE